MAQRWWATFSLIGLFLAFSVPPAAAQGSPVAFSADYLETTAGETTLGSFHAAPEGIRVETVVDGEPQVIINNFARGVIWIVQVQERVYLELPLSPEDKENFLMPCYDSDIDSDFAVKAIRVGRETLHGRAVEKYHCEVDSDIVEVVWFDPRLKMAIRSEDQHGDTFELRNIKEGRQPGDLFQLPVGYTRMDLPGVEMFFEQPADGQQGGQSGFSLEMPQDLYQDEESSAAEGEKEESGALRGAGEALRGLFGR